MDLRTNLVEKWQPILEHGDLTPIADTHKRAVTAQLLENTEIALREGSTYSSQSLLSEATHTPTNATGADVDNYDPVLISLVRRAMPNLVAYDMCGVQPMSGPTGLIFAMRSKYTNQSNSATESFYNEADTAFSTVAGNANTLGDKHVGTVPGSANNAEAGAYNFADGMPTNQAEALGNASNVAFPEMAFSIEKVSVTAGSRALKAEYTMELAQDLRAIHGLDAETELSNILSAEILAEINREVVRTINYTATAGAQENTTSAGTFDLDVDANGRWSVERFKGLVFQIEREANKIAKDTRRGKGNIMICGSDVASALQMAGVLDYTPALSVNLNVDDTGNTFAGVLNGRMKVYVDPYFASASGNQYATIGYKGASAFDAGMFYCPYVPLQMVRAVGEQSFQPKIGFKTRYGIVANPFATTGANGVISSQQKNIYYRIMAIANLM